MTIRPLFDLRSWTVGLSWEVKTLRHATAGRIEYVDRVDLRLSILPMLPIVISWFK